MLEEQAENLTESVTHGHVMNGRDVRGKRLLCSLQGDPLGNFLSLLCLSSCIQATVAAKPWATDHPKVTRLT